MNGFSWGQTLIVLGWWLMGGALVSAGQETQPLVAIHDSELTRALDSSNSPALPPTPIGPGTTGLQWWPTNWHYFVLPESVQEALRADGTTFKVVTDDDISDGLLVTNGWPRYPIVISLASEAIRDDEISPLTNYVAAGGFLLVGSSAFTRLPDGAPRGDFAFAKELGLHLVNPGLTNWVANNTFAKQGDHRIVSHIPGGVLTWRMPSAAEETSWGVSPTHSFLAGHYLWRVRPSDATVVAMGDTSPYLLVKPFGRGYFIYHAAFQPLVGHGGFAPGMYAYGILRKTIEWAFESARLPIPKLSPWPYPYDAAFMVRHDLENYSNAIARIEASAEFEHRNGAKGEYYFCTGTLREDMGGGTYDTNAVVAGLRRAVSQYQATIGPHNGGLRNPVNLSLVRGDYDYWHWGPDEALDVMPPGYPNGKAYAFASISNSFVDIENWLGGLTNGLRHWCSCYFNSTREDSHDILAQLGVDVAGEEKLSPFPHWTLSMNTSGKRYPFLSVPVSDWFSEGLVAQSLEPWRRPSMHTDVSLRAGIDFYYELGALINFYSHTLSNGEGDAGQLAVDYITYGLNTNLHPRLWSGNSSEFYKWSLERANAQVAVAYTTNGSQAVTTFSVSGATDTNTAVELLVPNRGALGNLQVFTNGGLASPNDYRLTGQTLKLQVGTTVTNAQVRYLLGPAAQDDLFTVVAGNSFSNSAPGVLSNDLPGFAADVTAVLVSGPANGDLTLYPNGTFSYTPAPSFVGTDRFTYRLNSAIASSSPATVTLVVVREQMLLAENFERPFAPDFLAPWGVPLRGKWRMRNGLLQGGPNEYVKDSSKENYSYVVRSNSWTDYSVEARIRFSAANAWGGGLGGRLDPNTGAHYAVWLYPEGSPGGGNVLKLLKFSKWELFGYGNTSYVPMHQIHVGEVGTNWHTLKLVFTGRTIAVHYDGNQVMDFEDWEAQPYLSGGVSLEMWTGTTPFVMEVAEVVVVSPRVCPDIYSAFANTPLEVAAPGLLANDSGLYGTNLTATLVSGPTTGTLNLRSNGSFSFVPDADFLGTASFVYLLNDGVTDLGRASVTIRVNPLPLRISSINLSNQVVWITWNSVPGKSYRLQYKESLTHTNWTEVLPPVTATGPTCAITNSLGSGSQRFYRMVLLP